MLIPLPRLAVQHECIPQAILGMDVICQAKSGMGKTAVFVLAVLQQLEPVPGEIGSTLTIALPRADRPPEGSCQVLSL